MTIKYIIYEAGDTAAETAYNRSFTFFTITWYPMEENLASIEITKIDTSKIAGEYPLVSYEETISTLSEASGLEISLEDMLVCELIYNKKIAHGYYIPCYRFYLEESDTGLDVEGLNSYAAYDIPAVSIS